MVVKIKKFKKPPSPPILDSEEERSLRRSDGGRGSPPGSDDKTLTPVQEAFNTMFNMYVRRKENWTYLTGRITKDDLSKEEIIEYLYPKYDQAVVSEETATNKHFHFLAAGPTEKFGVESKKFRAELVKHFELSKNYSLSHQKTDNYIPYVLKDGNYLFNGISKEAIKYFKELSHAKYDKETFAKELDKFQYDKRLSPDCKLFLYCKLKRKYNQRPTDAQLYEYYKSWMMDISDDNVRAVVKSVGDKYHRNIILSGSSFN